MSINSLNHIIWKDFINKINSISVEKPMGIYLTIKSWVLENINIFYTLPFSNYNIVNYCSLDINDYPIYEFQFNSYEFSFLIENLNKYSFKDKEDIARILSKIFEYLFVIRVDSICEFCDSDGLLVYKNLKDLLLVYECPQCGNAVYINNDFKQSFDKLTLPNRYELEKYNLVGNNR